MSSKGSFPSDNAGQKKAGTSRDTITNEPPISRLSSPTNTIVSQGLKSAMKRHHRKSQRAGNLYSRRRKHLGRKSDYSPDEYDYTWSDDTIISSSPLLNSTPPVVSRQLLKLYPYLIILDRFLGVLTWNNRESYWANYLLIIIFSVTVEYFEFITRYLGHVILILFLWLYSLLDKYVNSMVSAYPTLDDIVLIMGTLSRKADLVQAPITILNKQDITRLLFTIIFFTPCYIILTTFVMSPRHVFLILGIHILGYYSPLCRWLRRTLWRFKLVRLTVFYLTGLSIGGLTNRDKHAFRKAIEAVSRKYDNTDENSTERNKTPSGGIKYVFVLYENQRKWIGIGWTASMLSYERSCWTDEFLNPTSRPSSFKLPEDDSDDNQWRWLDTQWQVDKTNDGSIQLSSQESPHTPNPLDDEGFIYYDNTWKTPSLEDTFTKYTRRRRWVRTAEFISINSQQVSNSSSEKIIIDENETVSNLVDSTEDVISPEKKTCSDSSILQDTLPTRRRKVSFNELHNVHILPLNGYISEGDVSLE